MALSVMLSASTVWKSFGVVIALHDCVKAVEYAANLQSQTHPVIQHFSLTAFPFFQDDNITMHSYTQIQWFLDEMQCELVGLGRFRKADSEVNFHLLCPSKNWRLSFLKYDSMSR